MSQNKAPIKKEKDIRLVSIHGGHSGEFCTHATNRLKEIIKTYIEKGFSWVGITEHMPPVTDRFRYPDQIIKELTAENLYRQFANYIHTCRFLQKAYGKEIRIAVGFETETYSGAIPFVQSLVLKFRPDYIVGSVHHVANINFDCDRSQYNRAADAFGGLDALYQRYFDTQYEMLTSLKPAVVGHFDLIRIFDPNYQKRLASPLIKERWLRNLHHIKTLGLILDLNVRALYKGGSEPYIAMPILKEALELDIPVVPGDDSHGVETVGVGIEEGITILRDMGFNMNWRLPS